MHVVEPPDCLHSVAEQVDDTNIHEDPPRRCVDAANASSGHGLRSKHADTHAPQRTSEFSTAYFADSGQWEVERDFTDVAGNVDSMSGWAADRVEKSSRNPSCGQIATSDYLGVPATGLADMVAMELKEAQHMLAKSHQHVLRLLSGYSNFSSPASPRGPSVNRTYSNNTCDAVHHLVSKNTIKSIASSIHSRKSMKSGFLQSKPANYASEGFDTLSSETVPDKLNRPSVQSVNQKGSQFELFPCWQGTHELALSRAVKSGMVGRTSVTRTPSTRVGHRRTDQSITGLMRDVKWEQCVIHPCSIHRAIWDVLSLAFVAYDIAFVPLQLFDLTDYKVAILFMDWLTRIFWTCDVPISFFTGYLLQDGFITVNLHQIIFHYLTRWFILDLIMVGCDWIEFGIRASEEQTGRTVQFLQIIQCLRIARMREIIKMFHFRITSEKFIIMADIAKILCFIITVAHLMACLWYGISNAGEEHDKSWIASHHVEDSSLLYRYMISMHWSLSQFQGGMDEVRPHNLNTRIFNVVAFLVAFMVAAVSVSGLTSSMTRLDILASDRSRQLSVLRKYLTRHGISDKLALRVQRNALHAICEQERLMAEHKVELLAVISDPLRAELHFEMYSPVLEVHPFFDKYIQACPHVVQHICHRAVKTWLVSKGDIVFNIGEIPEFPQMYIICNGRCEYARESGEVTELSAEDYISESPLWIPWMHRGMLHSVMDGRLCAMDARAFQHIACHSEHTEFDPKVYAQEYVRRLNDCQDLGSEISDLPFDADDLYQDNSDSQYGSVKHGSFLSMSSAVFDGVKATRSNSSRKSNQKPTRSSVKKTSVLMGKRESTRSGHSSSRRSIVPDP